MANEPVDKHKLNHLTMWIDNDGDLYRQQYTPILKNLMTKRARGVFDAAKAEKLWMYLMDSGAKKLCKEFPGDYPRPWHIEFNMATRKAAAKEFNETFMHNAEQGDHDNLLPKKYQKKARVAVGGGKRRHAKKLPQTEKIICTGCGKHGVRKLAAAGAGPRGWWYGNHADTYSGTFWHCPKCTAVCRDDRNVGKLATEVHALLK